MAKIGDVLVDLRANTAQFNRSVGRSNVVTQTLTRSLFRLTAVLGAGFGLFRAARFIVNTNREFERFNAQLFTVQGSAEAATMAFKGIEDLAKKTPFQIEGLTRAFIQLRVFGVQPTRDTMMALGDFASAFGTTIEEMSVVVRSATAGQTESIRRFVENFEVMGDTVAITSNGMRKIIHRDAQSITDALVEISKNNFAGAMEREMATVNGIVSNIQDNLGILARNMGIALLPIMQDLSKTLLIFTEEVNANRGAIVKWTEVGIEGSRVIADAFVLAGSAILNVFQGIGETIGALMVTAKEAVFGTAAGTAAAWEIVKESIVGAAEDIEKRLSALQERWDTFLERWNQDAENTGKDTPTRLLDPMFRGMNNLGTGAGSVFGEAFAKAGVRGIINGFKEREKTLTQRLADILTGALTTALNAAISQAISAAFNKGGQQERPSLGQTAFGIGTGAAQGFALGGPAGAGIGAGIGVLGGILASARSDPSVNVTMPPPSNPGAMTRDRQWLTALAESNRVLVSNGFKFA